MTSESVEIELGEGGGGALNSVVIDSGRAWTGGTWRHLGFMGVYGLLLHCNKDKTLRWIWKLSLFGLKVVKKFGNVGAFAGLTYMDKCFCCIFLRT